MYVFGIDMPLMEILFTLFVINFIGLLFVLYEVKKMSSLLKIEKSDIKHLDSEIKTLEYFINSAPDEKLTEYVKKYMQAGTSEKEIKSGLIKAGFSESKITKIFLKLKNK